MRAGPARPLRPRPRRGGRRERVVGFCALWVRRPGSRSLVCRLRSSRPCSWSLRAARAASVHCLRGSRSYPWSLRAVRAASVHCLLGSRPCSWSLRAARAASVHCLRGSRSYPWSLRSVRAASVHCLRSSRAFPWSLRPVRAASCTGIWPGGARPLGVDGGSHGALAIGRLRCPVCGSRRKAVEDRLDRLSIASCIENPQPDLVSRLVRQGAASNDPRLELERRSLGQLATELDAQRTCKLQRLGQLQTRARWREIDQHGFGPEKAGSHPHALTDQRASAFALFGAAIELVEQKQAQGSGMNRSVQNHRDANATQMGRERFGGILDHGERTGPLGQVRWAGIEQSLGRGDHQLRRLDLLPVGKVRKAVHRRDVEFRQHGHEFGELAIPLQQNYFAVGLLLAIADMAGLSHEFALSFDTGAPMMASQGDLGGCGPQRSNRPTALQTEARGGDTRLRCGGSGEVGIG